MRHVFASIMFTGFALLMIFAGIKVFELPMSVVILYVGGVYFFLGLGFYIIISDREN